MIPELHKQARRPTAAPATGTEAQAVTLQAIQGLLAAVATLQDAVLQLDARLSALEARQDEDGPPTASCSLE